ncbi:hypothetical protein KBC79_06890, partial [Candidatus Woesebacteria bacterium]|nr:hypothetical protein [Candidatus Woesebacteria bacterium]
MHIPFGITFSSQQLRNLRLPVLDSLRRACSFDFSHIRIGVHWSEVEKKPEELNLEAVRTLLDCCELNHQSVVLTVGVKAPRWPEFYLPEHLQKTDINNSHFSQQLLEYVLFVVSELKTYSCITHWQVENEPLDPSGHKGMVVPEQLLREEVAVIRKLDPRPVILTLWANAMQARGTLGKLTTLADIVGLDLYYHQFVTKLFGKSIYTGPIATKSFLQKKIVDSPTPLWITELQAEPWEANMESYLSANPKSMSPELLANNVRKALALNPKVILFWGFEYWLWRERYCS